MSSRLPLVLALALSVSACGSESTDAPSTPPQTHADAAAEGSTLPPDAAAEDSSSEADAVDEGIDAATDAALREVGAETGIEDAAGETGIGDAAPEDAVDADSTADSSPAEVHSWPDEPLTGEYAGMELLEGEPLVSALCNLVTTGSQSISYTSARTVVLTHVDNHEGQVRTVYEGLWHTADPHSDVNIEHTWPQSKGADTVPARSDMHHLFPERSTFNSARGNYTFGEVVNRTWPSTLMGDASCSEHFTDHIDGCYSKKGTDAYGVTVFEPRDGHKGDTARAIFYFSLRYGTACKVKPLSVLDPAHPQVTELVLKHWNYVDPPDEHERRRNDLVEHTQDNRNPFIDYPQLVDRISFN